MRQAAGSGLKAARRTGATPPRRGRRAPREMARLRYAYFAQAADPAGRYGIEFEHIVRHMWRLRQRRGRVPLRSIRHVDDLVHAIACLERISLAWTDLVDHYEPMLVRRCSEQLGEMRAILMVRRMFASVRADCRHREGGDPQHLATYHGDRPLRVWLAARVTSTGSRRHSVWCRPRIEDGAGRASLVQVDAAASLAAAGPDHAPVSLPFPGIWTAEPGEEELRLPREAAGARSAE